MKWDKHDWYNRDVQELYLTYDYLKKERVEDWKQTRLICWWVANTAGKTYKKPFGLSDIFWLPGDKLQRRKGKPGKRIVLNREEIREEYEKAGIDVSEDFLDKIMSKRNAGRMG